MAVTLVSFPGRAGDLLWACSVIKLIGEREGPVDLLIAGEFVSMVPLLRQQPYLRSVYADPRWGLSPEQAWQPPQPYWANPDLTLPPHGVVLHLGYRRWPELPLPFETYNTAVQEYGLTLPPLDLGRPWIQVAGPRAPCDVAVGFTEAWFELKFGLLHVLRRQLNYPEMVQLTPVGSRWGLESTGILVAQCSWLEAAQWIAGASLFFGDCSALHVLAVALDKPVVLCEPMEARWNSIFYPLGMDGPQVTVVKGHDGNPTFDARACADALREALHAR